MFNYKELTTVTREKGLLSENDYQISTHSGIGGFRTEEEGKLHHNRAPESYGVALQRIVGRERNTGKFCKITTATAMALRAACSRTNVIDNTYTHTIVVSRKYFEVLVILFSVKCRISCPGLLLIPPVLFGQH